jgi:hypothetical protein
MQRSLTMVALSCSQKITLLTGRAAPDRLAQKGGRTEPGGLESDDT